MKTLKHLEKSRYIWFLIGICVIFFVLRLPSLIEPNWYGDEGIYQIIGLALQNGQNLYTNVWDNKPPLLYLLYAFFGSDQFTIRLVSLVFGVLATILFFALAKNLLDIRKAIIITALFAVLFGTPYLEGNIANAENFMLLFIISAGFLIYRNSNLLEQTHTRLSFAASITSHKPFLIAGLLLGIAFLFKTVAVFDFLAFTLFLLLTLQREYAFRGSTVLHKIIRLFRSSSYFLIPLFSGFLLPIIVTFLVFALQGTLAAFIQAAFFGNIDYVGYGNAFIIPQGLLIIKVLFFLAALLWIIINAKSFTKQALFVLLWFVFALFSAFFSQRPYTHYLLVLLPSFCLMIGLLLSTYKLRVKAAIALMLLLAVFAAVSYFHVYGIMRTGKYYQNVLSFLNGQLKVREYQAFFDPETPRDYELVSYINRHAKPEDRVFIWGDSPQIYVLSKKLPLNKYTVSYHIYDHPHAFDETQAAIDKIQPKFIITLSEAPPLPFRVPNYSGIYGTKGAAIYERSF